MKSARDIFCSSVNVSERLQRIKTMTITELDALLAAPDNETEVQLSVQKAIRSRKRRLERIPNRAH